MKKTLNYQQLYEEEVSDSLLQSLEKPDRFFELSNSERMLVEELIDLGYNRALEDALDPELLEDTASLAADMGSQLYNFANMLKAWQQEQGNDDDSLT
jgi:hypothetical protein